MVVVVVVVVVVAVVVVVVSFHSQLGSPSLAFRAYVRTTYCRPGRL